MENLLNLVPLPIALGMVLYVNHRLDDHAKNCPIGDKLEEIHKDIRELRTDIRVLRG